MSTVWILLNIAIMLLIIFGLYTMQKKHISFSKRVFTALAVGIVFGVGLQLIYGAKTDIVKDSIEWFNVVGKGYIKLLQMIVMPLVFISILAAFTKVKLTNNIGKISSLIIGILIATTALAAAIGIGTTLAFNLEAVQIQQGDQETSRAAQLEKTFGQIQDLSLPQKIVELLPANPFLDLTGQRSTSTIAVVIFAALLGVAFLGVKGKQPEHATFFAKIVDTFYTIIMRVVSIILRLTPYGVLALMTKVTATSDYLAILKLGKFVLASYVAILIMFVVHLILLAITGLNPISYLKKTFSVLTFAFTSRSSAGALPLNVETQRDKLGVPEGIANFAGSFGLSIGQNGCAGIYPAMLAVMIAPTIGIDPLTPSFIVTLIAVVAISSFGVAGVGGGATFAALLVLSTMNMPIALAGLLISVEPLIDMGRTALNVSGSMVAGVVTSRVTKELDTTIYNDQMQKQVEV
ncbi:L-cystine transporter [Brevibacillus laterosporus]|uniref:L-cystine uptake protein TcyP n=1 Tax=Brevibacillus laterosporus TaxID=1465 RepID=A0AAP3DGF5_BRELA|nr:L-cystine transporter [Brevibacillus laterosporus]MBG9790238.1 sodium:dicarboxylate symporter [Brevibacillus laterosporus]MCR8980428.1 L-cystine transporter [Brevibacillus laterosporus]MCZ0807583.1 L-cystine transporter [Brevibacillus laterosporus]MCZ0828022.1 L-cystine transporter [Brevibacillus laterosporus]MCZ0851861.1 L-cystine transporter [Brevibacillus laterosporus]